jgi:hypothetical protein
MSNNRPFPSNDIMFGLTVFGITLAVLWAGVWFAISDESAS